MAFESMTYYRGVRIFLRKYRKGKRILFRAHTRNGLTWRGESRKEVIAEVKRQIRENQKEE